MTSRRRLPGARSPVRLRKTSPLAVGLRASGSTVFSGAGLGYLPAAIDGAQPPARDWLFIALLVVTAAVLSGLVMLALYRSQFQGFQIRSRPACSVTLPLASSPISNDSTTARGQRRTARLAGRRWALMTKYCVLTMTAPSGLAALIIIHTEEIPSFAIAWFALATFAVARIPHLMWLRKWILSR